MIGAEISSEREVERRICNLVKQTPGLVLADFTGADIDRLNSFYKASKKCDRKLALSMRQAHLVNKLRGDPQLEIPNIHDSDIMVFQKSKKRYYNWEKEILQSANIADASKIGTTQDSARYDFEELIDIKPLQESCYLLSASEPYNEEMELDFERLTNWMAYYGLPEYHIHASGHIMPLQLRKVLRTARAFPVHWEYPGLFERS